jgi:hypothetical protein
VIRHLSQQNVGCVSEKKGFGMRERQKIDGWTWCFWGVLGVGLLFCGSVGAVELSRGQMLFLPVYSEIPYGDRKASLNLAVTVTVRNLDVARPLTLKRIDYLDEHGVVVRALIERVTILKPLAAEIFQIRESDRSGGRAAGVLMEWESGEGMVAPLLEGVMVNGAYNQGLAFVTAARVLDNRR